MQLPASGDSLQLSTFKFVNVNSDEYSGSYYHLCDSLCYFKDIHNEESIEKFQNHYHHNTGFIKFNSNRNK